MKQIKIITIVFSLILILAACSSQPNAIGVKQSYDRNQYDLSKPRTVSVTASGFQLFLLIPISTNSRFERAYSQIQRQAGDGLIGDVKVTESWSYAFVGTIYRTTLEATIYPKQ